MSITIQNDGPLISDTDFWGSEFERAGRFFCSVNAGALRLLVPRTQVAMLAECRTAEYVIISRGPWPAQRAEEAVELLFEDHTNDPYSMHLNAESFHALPAEPPPGSEWQLSVWVLEGERPHKTLQLPCRWRRSQSLPDLSPWPRENDDSGPPDVVNRVLEQAAAELRQLAAVDDTSDARPIINKAMDELAKYGYHSPPVRRSRCSSSSKRPPMEHLRGVSAAQFPGRLKAVIETHSAAWLTPLLQTATNAWKIVPDEAGKRGSVRREEVLLQVAALLKRHAELALRKRHAGLLAEVITRNARRQARRQAQKSDPHDDSENAQELHEKRQRLQEQIDGCNVECAEIERETLQILSRDGATTDYLTTDKPTEAPAHVDPLASIEDQHQPVAVTVESLRGAMPESGGDSSALETIELFDTQPALPLLPPPSSARRGTTILAAATAFLNISPADVEYDIRRADLLWALIGEGHLLAAHWYLESLDNDAEGMQLDPKLMKAAALSPFVCDDSSVVATIYHETLIQFDVQRTQNLLERRRTIGLYALGLAASVQAALFFPVCGAPRLLRASNHGLPPDLSRMLTDIVNLGEQGICISPVDFISDRAHVTGDSNYRQQRVQPILQCLTTQLPIAIEYFQRTAAEATALEDEAGCRAASKALQALREVISGSRPRHWSIQDIVAWIELPRLLAAGAEGMPTPEAIATCAARSFNYDRLAQESLTTENLRLARALLYELERIGSEDVSAQALRSFVAARAKVAREFDKRARTLRARLDDTFCAQVLSESDYQTYIGLLDDLERARREDRSQYPALLEELEDLGKLMEESRAARMSELRASAATLRTALRKSKGRNEVSQAWLEEIQRSLGQGNLTVAEEYVGRLRRFLEEDTVLSEFQHHRIIMDRSKRRDSRTASYSPLMLADEMQIAGLDGTARESERQFTISLIFGASASGIEQVPHALESLHQVEPDNAAPYWLRTVSADKSRSLRELRECTRRLAARDDERRILHIEMPYVPDDPGLHAEILERVYKLRPRSAQGALRAVLTFGPGATWQWLASGCGWLEPNMVVISMGSWAVSALKALLSDLQFMSSPRDVDLLQRKTGGWPIFLQSFQRAAHSAPLLKGPEEILRMDAEGLASLDRAAACRALHLFGLTNDVPYVSGIVNAIVANGCHEGFDREVLRLIVADRADWETVSADTVMSWGMRLGLFSSFANQGAELRMDPAVAYLISSGTSR